MTFLLKFPVSPILLMCLWGDSELWVIHLCHLDPLTLPFFDLNHWELTLAFSWSPARWSYMTWCKDQGNCHNSSCFNRLHACCCTSHSESQPDHPAAAAAAAAAAKSLQSCTALCDPIDGNPPRSAIPGILQARTLDWVAISFSWSPKDIANSDRDISNCNSCFDPDT